MSYLCQFGKNLVISWEDRVQTSFFFFIYVPGDLVNKVEVTKIVLAVPDKYLCKFR